MAHWRKGKQAASLIRHIIEDFHRSRSSVTVAKIPEIRPIEKPEVNGEQKSKEEVLHKIPEEEHLTSTYRHYLNSTRRLEALQEKYRGGERSLEESAKLVGLKLPVLKS